VRVKISYITRYVTWSRRGDEGIMIQLERKRRITRWEKEQDECIVEIVGMSILVVPISEGVLLLWSIIYLFSSYKESHLHPLQFSVLCRGFFPKFHYYQYKAKVFLFCGPIWISFLLLSALFIAVSWQSYFALQGWICIGSEILKFGTSFFIFFIYISIIRGC
jgi:hypothetical protein